MTEWIYCRVRLPPRNTWVYICLSDCTKGIAKRTLFFNNWIFTGGFKQSIHQHDKWMGVEGAPLQWRIDAVKNCGCKGILIND